MCGIAGFVGEGADEILDGMNTALSRRGPDDCGTFHEGSIALAQTRLSIIDLSPGGHQPMMSSTGNAIVVFNGEIYNYRALRAELERAGAYRFTNDSDTEVILALYERYGTSAFKRLEGMFAIALYDMRTQEIFLARDRLGKKPLYWALFDGVFVFGSELKALMAHPAFRKEIDPESVALYLTYEYVPTPRTIFKGVHKAPAGSYIRYREGEETSETPYWKKPESVLDISFDDAVKQLDTLLAESVEKRLVADVPVGVFLSGGLDSSVVAYYAQRAKKDKLRTFSIGFTDPDFDESRYAKLVADHLGVEHSMEMLSPERCIELIPEVFSYLDEPIADPAILPTYLLSGFTRKHVTVALGGNAADELFAGYQTFQAEQLIGLYEMLPSALRRGIIEPLIRTLPVRHSYFSLDFKLKKFIEGAGADPRYRHQRWIGAFPDRGAFSVMREEFRQLALSPYSLLDQYFTPGASKGDYLNDVLWAYTRTYLMDEVMAQVDRASMAHALEARTPFMDHALVEFVQRLPFSYKYRQGQGKYILKKLVEDRLPREIVYRKKKGFGIPMGRWLQHELKPLSDELLSKEAIEQSGFLDWTAVNRLKEEHERGIRDHRKKLWTIMTFQLWYRQWGS